jgi:hypothetical protein
MKKRLEHKTSREGEDPIASLALSFQLILIKTGFPSNWGE